MLKTEGFNFQVIYLLFVSVCNGDTCTSSK